jgi:hypothetical protein
MKNYNMDSTNLKKIDLLDPSLRGQDQAKQREQVKMATKSTSHISNKEHVVICFGFRCSNNSTGEIIVDAGVFGKITLSLCPTCRKKFSSE